MIRAAAMTACLLAASGAAAQPLAQAELDCLSALVYKEARGEPRDGQIGVVNVALNRARKRRMGVCQVIAQPGQFSWYRHDASIRTAAALAARTSGIRSVVLDAIDAFSNGEDITNGAMFFHSTRLKYSKRYVVTTVIGNHRFLKVRDEQA